MAKILIVEDDTNIAKLIAQELVSAGHVCAIQSRGREVMDRARSDLPDLIILDVMIPDISGFELCRSIRRDDKLYTLPILIVSAMTEEEEVAHGLAQGADDYLTKPFEMVTLLSRVKGLLDARERTTHHDELTALPDAEGVRRELQRRVNLPDPFALVYTEILRLREFAESAGAKGREKVLRHVARALQQCGRSFDKDTFFVGHMGGGHFVSLVPPNDAQSYCEHIATAWKEHVSELYESLGLRVPANKTPSDEVSAPKSLDLTFFVTSREPHEWISAADMLNVVSRIRKTRLEQGTGGIHVDRRL